jgi:hypothetical protein
MKTIALYDLDFVNHDPRNRKHERYRNVALMKISRFFKSKGNHTELITGGAEAWDPKYSEIIASKVFSWTKVPALPENSIIGGSGTGDYDLSLPDYIENLCPDYDLYPGNYDYSMGFLTRGCIRKCYFCSVRAKEGHIRPAADIEQFARHKKVLLMDNNILACDHGIHQLEKIAQLGLQIDLNQGIDARLIDDGIAKILARVKWWEPVRLACDSDEMMPVVQKAVATLRWHNVKPRTYNCYVLIDPNDFEGSVERIKFLKGLGLDPYAQPYMPPSGQLPSERDLMLAHYVDDRNVFWKNLWEDYRNGVTSA